MNLKTMISLALLLAIAMTQQPPVWPAKFTQDFAQSYMSSRYHTVGRLWYDSERAMQRLDRNNGKYVALCSTIKDEATPCHQIMRQGKRFIFFPLLQQCCLCCDAPHGCGLLRREWLHNAKFVGKEDLSGGTFNKFEDVPGQIVYWSALDDRQTPRKLIEDGERIKDFIMNTYSEDEIDVRIFELPPYCDAANLCPKESKCGKFMQ